MGEEGKPAECGKAATTKREPEELTSKSQPENPTWQALQEC